MDNLDQLLADLALARTNEAHAKERRVAAEEAVLKNMDLKERGATSLSGNNGLKVTVTTGFNYKLDKGSIIPEGLPTKTEVKLDTTKYEKIRQEDPELFKTISKVVTATPKKPSVSLKVG